MINMLPADWEVRQLKNCGEWLSGGTPRKSVAEYWNGHIPWISAKSMHDFFISDSEDCVTKLGIENGTRLVPENTILFVVRGMSLAQEFRIGITQREVAFNQDLKAIIASEEINPYFLAYAMKAVVPEIMSRVDEASHGTRRLTTRALASLEIPVPPYDEQLLIAKRIRACDDKIELNREMNATLEAIARALFKSWFIDFDPVRRNQDGRPTQPYDHLFPAKLEEDENGREHPEGWQTYPIKQIAELQRNSVRPEKYPEEEFDYFSFSAYNDGQEAVPELGSEIRSNKYLVPSNCVLLSKLNPRTPRIWFVNPKKNKRSICSTEFLVMVPKENSSREYLYCLFTSEQFLNRFQQLVTGTSSSHQRVKPKQFLSMEVIIATPEIIHKFTSIVKPLFQKINENRLESQTLASLRDTLLPRLMSGQFRIPTNSHK